MVDVLLAALLHGVLTALVVFVYGLFVSPLLGRPRYAMSVVDIAFLAVFVALIFLLLQVSGVWSKIMSLI